MSLLPLSSEQHQRTPDQRQFPRQRVETLEYVGLGDDNGGVLFDVSEGGINFQGVQPLEIDQRFPISFMLPGIDKPVETTGQVAWLYDSGRGGGLRFVDMPEDTQQLLKEWIFSADEAALSAEEDLPDSDPGFEEQLSQCSPVVSLPSLKETPSSEVRRNLADVLRDSSISQAEAIAAVNRSRTVMLGPSPVPARQTFRFQGYPLGTAVSPARPKQFLSRPLIFLAAMVLLGALLFLFWRAHPVTRSPHPNPSPISPGSPMGLKLERNGTDWQVSWNRNAEVVINAAGAHLSIADGAFHKELDLDPGELQSGSIMYTPMTDDFVVRLQILNENSEQPVSESVRIVGAKTH